MKRLCAVVVCGLAAGLSGGEASRTEAPFNALRFGPAYTDPGPWSEMRAALKKNVGAFDEVWFSTGITFPKLDWHARHAAECAAAAADLRAMGIVPSVEIQTIIGHADNLLVSGDCTGRDWGTWVGADGTAAQHVSCPSDPRLAAYFARVGELYAAWKPGSMWIDDDVTLRNRAPMKDWSKALFGCFCERCLAGFSKAEGRIWPREELASAIRADAEVARRWEAYQCGNFANLCRTIAAAVHAVSPETVFGYQYGYSGRPAIVKGIYDGCGLPVRLRPGAGAYWDSDAHQQLDKAYQLQGLSEMMGHPDWIAERCPEIESCPRTFACRTPQGVILEAFENLALGMDFLSMFVADARANESTDYYADLLFPRLREAMPFLRGYRDASRGTWPCGFEVARGEPAKLVATRGLPIVGARAKSLGPLPDLGSIKVRMGGSGFVDVQSRDYQTRVMQIASSAELTNFYARCDQASGFRLPVRFARAVMAFALPRVTDDGTLTTLALVNASIDRQEPVRVFLRKLPEGCASALWKTPGGEGAVLPVERQGDQAWVTLPVMGAWTCAYLEFRGNRADDEAARQVLSLQKASEPLVEIASLPLACTPRTTVAGETPSLLPDGRRFSLVWHDEFAGDALDESKWSYRTNFWGRPAHWFAKPEDGCVEVKDGVVKLKIKKLANGQFVSPQLQTGELMWDVTPIENPNSFWWLGKRMKPKFAHRYGYYECRCRLQKKAGWWSAFWMQTEMQGACLDPGLAGIEQDIMESFDPGEVIVAAFHTNGYGPDYKGFHIPAAYDEEPKYDGKLNLAVDTESFHTFGLLWEPDGYSVYVDGRFRGKNSEAVSHVPEFVLLSTECKWYRSNRMTGVGVPELEAAAAAGDEFVVDWVRVYDLEDE